MASPAVLERMIQTFRDNGLSWLLTVPSTGMQPLYMSYEAAGRCVFATREEEAIAVASGLRLGGARPVVVMQQSGVGNAINAALSLADAYEIGFPVVVIDRTADDPNPVQRVSSVGTARVLRALDCVELDWENPDVSRLMCDSLQRGVRWFHSPMIGSK